eukprot:11156316-Lingulodinium_polyedra.AAC.3
MAICHKPRSCPRGKVEYGVALHVSCRMRPQPGCVACAGGMFLMCQRRGGFFHVARRPVKLGDELQRRRGHMDVATDLQISSHA